MIDLLHPHKPCCKCREEIDSQAGRGVTWLGDDPYHSECAPIQDRFEACDGYEQPAFEAWAKRERYAMHEHPLHYIFMDEKTNAARMGWNAALAYVRAVLAKVSGD